MIYLIYLDDLDHDLSDLSRWSRSWSIWSIYPTCAKLVNDIIFLLRNTRWCELYTISKFFSGQRRCGTDTAGYPSLPPSGGEGISPAFYRCCGCLKANDNFQFGLKIVNLEGYLQFWLLVRNSFNDDWQIFNLHWPFQFGWTIPIWFDNFNSDWSIQLWPTFSKFQDGLSLICLRVRNSAARAQRTQNGSNILSRELEAVNDHQQVVIMFYRTRVTSKPLMEWSWAGTAEGVSSTWRCPWPLSSVLSAALMWPSTGRVRKDRLLTTCWWAGGPELSRQALVAVFVRWARGREKRSRKAEPIVRISHKRRERAALSLTLVVVVVTTWPSVDAMVDRPHHDKNPHHTFIPRNFSDGHGQRQGQGHG